MKRKRVGCLCKELHQSISSFRFAAFTASCHLKVDCANTKMVRFLCVPLAAVEAETKGALCVAAARLLLFLSVLAPVAGNQRAHPPTRTTAGRQREKEPPLRLQIELSRSRKAPRARAGSAQFRGNRRTHGTHKLVEGERRAAGKSFSLCIPQGLMF